MNAETLKVDWYLEKKNSCFRNTDKNASTSILMHKWLTRIITVWAEKVNSVLICLFLPLTLGESQTLLAAAAERERAATEELMSNKVQMSSTESQNSRLRQENSRLQAQVEMERNKLKKMEVENSRWVEWSQLSIVRTSAAALWLQAGILSVDFDPQSVDSTV